jgi:glycosyltransferase involved in cell wall biosynthesis
VTIHVIGFVHTRFDDVTFSHCAFTSKVVRWVEMMAAAGERIIVYWGGDSPPGGDYGMVDYVSMMSDAEQNERFGAELPNTILDLDWNPNASHWRMLNHRAAAALYTHWREGDVIAVLSGSNHDTLMTEFSHTWFVEPWVGYAGISKLSRARCFESSAWRHYMYGQHQIADGLPLDTVIPNYYRPNDFRTGDDDGYLLYVGRMIQRKGIMDIIEVARRSKRKLYMVGQGARVDEENDTLVCDDGTVMNTLGVDVTYFGIVQPGPRADLYARASATIAATTYIEPFGGVFAEAMLSGVQPVCRNWGAFVEYVDGRYRFDDVDQAVDAVDRAVIARGPELRERAIETFSVETATGAYAEWLGRIRDTMAR